MDTFERELVYLINKYGIDSKMSVADYIVAKHVIRFMEHLKDINTDLVEIDPESDMHFDDSMDGDHASALASAGHGTDEDYGGTDERF